ncbi:Hypothetical protein GLP15_5162 [Giardia lamblia P15]|uniref:Uncharacterized protein n=1 Tax=Giardia intestinalis (strain P15) TaxID=658858 RepID=E1EW94_GIAIA|nr:Hypothetical protein GLP15_5162 [Giardia lamblia P15]
MLLDESTNVVETNIRTQIFLDNAEEQCRHVSTPGHESPLSVGELNPSPTRSPCCRTLQFLAERNIGQYHSNPLQSNPQAVLTPSLDTGPISNCNASTTSDCLFRDPESLLLSIINMATSSPPQASIQKPPPMIQSSMDSCQVLESLPHLSSLQMSPIPERKEHSLRPTTALDPQCNAGMLFTRERCDFSNALVKLSRCLSAKVVLKHPDSIFDSELESSCITPRFLHVVPLRDSPTVVPQTHLNEDGQAAKQMVSTCSPQLHYLTHTESSVISTVDSLDAPSSCTIVTPTAPLSARFPPLSTLNVTKQQVDELERLPSRNTDLSSGDIKVCTERRQIQLTRPVPLLALPQDLIDTKDNVDTNTHSNTQIMPITYVDDKELNLRYGPGLYSRLKRDSDGSTSISARRSLPLETQCNVAHLKLPNNTIEPGKSSVRSTTDNIHLDFALPECSSARYDPSTRQLERSVQNFEPEQLCIFNPRIETQDPVLESAALQPLIAVATRSNAHETSTVPSFHLTDITVESGVKVRPDKSCVRGNTNKQRCKSTPSSRSCIRPVPCHDPIFDAASFKLLSESEEDSIKLNTLECYSLRKVHTSLLTHDSSTGYGPGGLSKLSNSTTGPMQERPRKYLITSGRISITPARKNLRVSLIQLEQLFDESPTVCKNEENKRCRSSGSTRTRNTTTGYNHSLLIHDMHSTTSGTCPATLIPITASSRGQSRSSERIESSLIRQSNRTVGSRDSINHTTRATPHQRKATSTPGPHLRLRSIIPKESPVLPTIKHSNGAESSARVRPHQERLQTSSKQKRGGEDYREDIRQAMMRLSLSSTSVDKYRTVSIQQRLKGLHPLVRGSKVISDD